jgi:phage terminase large subunit GpA-like protein
MNATELVNAAWNVGMTPPPMTLVSEWADKNRELPESAPEPGPYRTARTPYMRDIMDCLSPSSMAREIDLMKGTQTGGTEAAYNWIGFTIDQSPTNILCVLPDQATAKEWSQQRLAQLIQNTPCLRGKVKEPRDRDGGNATFTKKFGSAYLKMAWASSAKKMRSTPASNLIGDEIDGWVRDSSGEGNPVALLRRRFTNYPEGKFFRVSTPTDRATSLIEQCFNEGDQRYFFVPCPFCHHHQVIRFPNLKWDRGDYGSVHLRCISCNAEIAERWKTGILAKGRWIATKTRPELVKNGIAESDLSVLDPIFKAMRVARHVSFHLSGLYSPLGWYSWCQVAEDWEKAQRNPKDLKTFVNTVIAESWLEQGAAPEWEVLYERSGSYKAGEAPYGTLFLTAGVDVQGDRLEVEIVGWGRHFHSWSIDYHVILGDPKDTETWDKLEEYLRKPIEHASGHQLQISVIGVDTGYSSKVVYRFAGRFPRAVHGHGRSYISRPLTLVPTKGGHSGIKLIENISNEDAARTRRGLKIVTIGTHTAKQELYDWLRARPAVDLENGQMKLPFGYTFYPRYEPSYFQGLCSETRVVRDNGKVEWIKDPAVRNEPLDCRIMARAMACLYGMDRFTEKQWSELEESLRPVEQDETPAAQPAAFDAVPTPAPMPTAAPMPQAVRSQPVQPYQPIRSNWMRR